ncbi:hypothetical protein Naga_101322g2 [Nannochloropsis gaditana]|uniref:Uncharacterized protein n=1 Tax=Nannochloropsis gaditana TaxID=72520 RepID=W7U977_9STRA|nr:hypothetical protein Naga_101322g2 [Nannochloropsis gaditana]
MNTSLFLCLLLGLTAACPWTVPLPISLWGVFGTRPCWNRFCHKLASGGEILVKLSTAIRVCSDSNWLGGSGRDIFKCESDGYCCGHLTPSWRFPGPADQVPSISITAFHHLPPLNMRRNLLHLGNCSYGRHDDTHQRG